VAEFDRLRRFLFEDAPLRGHWVRLSRAWIEAREHQGLPPPIMTLLGESLAAAALFSASLKFKGTLTLQLAGSTGPVSMLVAQATDTRTLRGMAHQVSADADNDADVRAEFRDLVKGGRLVVSVEQGDGITPWQGIVPLEGDTLARCLEGYFAVSEQLPTIIVLAANAEVAAGMLLQKLPAPELQGEGAAAVVQDVWDEVTAHLGTLGADELLTCEPQELLRRLFGSHDLRLFDGESVHFACRCSRERVASMLRGLGQSEVDSIVTEQGAVTVTCEFCQRPYRFDAVDAQRLFLSPSGVADAESIN
jgi:molecular chaperone Hsp33